MILESWDLEKEIVSIFDKPVTSRCLFLTDKNRTREQFTCDLPPRFIYSGSDPASKGSDPCGNSDQMNSVRYTTSNKFCGIKTGDRAQKARSVPDGDTPLQVL